MPIFKPIWPWSHLGASAAVLAVLIILARGLFDHYRGDSPWFAFGNSLRARLAVLILTLFAAVFLATAALNPIQVETADPAKVHLHVVLDVSDSIMRTPGGWNTVKQTIRKRLHADLSSLHKDFKKHGSAGISTFRGHSSTTVKKVPLHQLPHYFDSLQNNDFATGQGTNIETGLEGARLQFKKTGGNGAILLISDGNQTKGKATIAAQRLARQGIPIHVYPLSAQGPALAITAADLPRQTHANIKTFLRGVLFNRQDKDQTAQLTFKRNPRISAAPSQFSTPVTLQKPFQIPARQWVRLRWPVVFQGCGLQFVDLSLSASTRPETHQRRFYTHVNRPPKILAIGGDNRWIAAVPQDTAQVIQVTPAQLNPYTHFQDIDAIVIGSVPAHQLTPAALLEIAEGVEKRGLGLMLINGGHIGAQDETETVLMSYNNTPLEDLLPVRSGPRAFTPDIPPRNVVILIDTSGSMSGHNLELAKKIAAYIIKELLREQDRLDLITFTTGAGHLVKNRSMTEQGKEDAISILNEISAGGGTDPNRALALVGNRKLNSCGLIFISDGYFQHLKYRPDCRATVFAIGRSSIPKNSPMWQLADPIPVYIDFDPEAITIPYFEPEPRLKFYQRGLFTPLTMEHHLPKSQRLPVPPIPLQGAAVSTLKPDAILNAVRPRLTDPILAFRKSKAGYVGAFTSQIPPLWLSKKEGKKAIETWLTRIVPYMARERYHFKIEDLGDVLDITIWLVAKKDKVPAVHRLAAQLRLPDQAPTGVSLRPDESSPSTFRGQIRVKRLEHAQPAFLVLSETGPDALDRSQQVPLLIPPLGSVRSAPSAEEFSYGRNHTLLQALTRISGGSYDPPPGTPFFHQRQSKTQLNQLWQYVLALSILCYLAAIAIMRWNR